MRVFIFLVITTIGYGQVNVDQRTTLTKISDNINIGKTNFGHKFATKIIYYHYPPTTTTATTTTEGKITAPYNLQPEYWHGQRFLGEIESSFAGTPQDLYTCIMSSFKFFKTFTNVPDENICERETRTFAEYLKYRLISEEEKQELKSVKKRMKILTKRLMTISSIERNGSSPLQQKYVKEKPELKNGEQTTKSSINSLATTKLYRIVTTLISPAKDYFEVKLKHKNPRETMTNLTNPLTTTKFNRIVPTRILPIKDFFEAKLKHKSSKQTMRNLTKPLTITKFYKNTTISPVKQNFKEKAGINKSEQTVKILSNSTTKFHQIKGEEEKLKSARLTMNTRSKPLITTQTHRNVSTTALKDDNFEGKSKLNATNQTITDPLISMELKLNTSYSSPNGYYDTWPVKFGLSVIGLFLFIWLIVLTIGLCLTQKKRSRQKNTCALTAFQTGTFRRVENI